MSVEYVDSNDVVIIDAETGDEVASDVTTLDVVSNELAVAERRAVIAIDEATGRPCIPRVDDIVDEIDKCATALEEYDFTGTDEERIANNKFLASVRSFQKNVRSVIKDYSDDFLGQLSDDAKRIVEAAKRVETTGVRRKSECDEAFKNERTDAFSELLDGVRVMDERLDDIDLDDLLDKSWFNRTFQLKKALEALNERISVYTNVLDLNLMPDYTPSEAADVLSENGWETTGALKAYQEDMKARADAEALRKQRELEKAERAARAAARTVIKVSIPNEQVEEFREVLTKAGIDFKEIG